MQSPNFTLGGSIFPETKTSTHEIERLEAELYEETREKRNGGPPPIPWEMGLDLKMLGVSPMKVCH